MGYLDQSRVLVEELKAILQANPDIDVVSTDALAPLTSEDASSAVYIAVESIALEQSRLSGVSAGYDRHMLITLYCNYDGTADPLGVFDFVDSIERSVLVDSELWGSVIDRDLVAINFDNQEFAPKRAIAMLFDFSFRIDCEN